MARYETRLDQPLQSDWRNCKARAGAGAKGSAKRATDIGQEALTESEEPPLDPAIREELETYVAKRREEIGSGEP